MNSKKAIKIILGILIAFVIFHLCIMIKLIPYDITWGGKLKNDSEMYVFESISILVLSLFGWILLIKGGMVKSILPKKVISIILWIFLFIFVLNTIGNVFAETTLEKGFALVTLAIAVLLGVILKKKT